MALDFDDHRDNLLLQVALGMAREEDVHLTDEERAYVNGMRKRIEKFKEEMGDEANQVTFEVPFD